MRPYFAPYNESNVGMRDPKPLSNGPHGLPGRGQRPYLDDVVFGKGAFVGANAASRALWVSSSPVLFPAHAPFWMYMRPVSIASMKASLV